MHEVPSRPSSVLPETRIVAFIDILGFRHMVAGMGPENPASYSRIRRALAVLMDTESRSSAAGDIGFNESDAKLKVTSFSDSVVLSALPVGRTGNAERKICGLAMKLSISLLREGIFCRGGIAVGPFHHENKVLFGPGMIEAYELESQSANYPRIVLADAVAEPLQPQFSDRNPVATIARDFDGHWFLDMFATLRAQLINESDCVREFSQIRKVIVDRLRQRGRHKHLARWRWCAKRLNHLLEESTGEDWSRKIAMIDLDDLGDA